MKKIVFLLAITVSTAAWAEEPIQGNVHAVINSDGSISYYLRGVEFEKPQSWNISVAKQDLTKFIGRDTDSVRAFEVIFGVALPYFIRI